MLVANNMISGSASVGGWGSPIMGRVGIIAQAKAQIIHNTIVHPYREQISTGISLSNGADSSTVLNNIVVEYGIPLGILVRSIVLFDQAVVMPGLISDYNVFFYNQTGVYLAAVGSNRYTSLSAYQAASSLDANSISKQVEFSGDDRYPHLSDCQGQDPQLNGVPYPGIVNDIDGDPRSVSTPTRGADEGRLRAMRMFGDVFRARVRSGMAQLYYHTVATGRFDNLMVDGLAVTDFAGRQIQLYHTLPQTRSFVLSGTLPLDFGPLSVRFFDLDHDGYLDVIAGGDTNVVKVFWGDGVGGFSQSTTVPTRGWVRSIDTARVSFYNMRTVALMEASGLTPDMSFLCYLNNTSGRNLAHHTVVKSLPGGGSVPDTLHDLLTDFAVGDLDGNGSHEVASPGTHQRFYVFRDTAFGNVPWGHHDIHTYSTQAFGSSASIAMARFSGGLLNDIITPGWSVPQHHTCILLRNQGGMNFSPDTILSGTYPYALVSMDYDNDGDLDCIAANWDLKRQGVSVFLNDGAGHFTEELNCHQGFGSDIPLSIVASDYDLDGRDDLAIATADSLFVLYNLGNVTAIDEDPKSGIPAEFSLEQNYPNPFNPATHISFSVPDFGFVSLKVYDILGREVEMLVNELKAPGRHSVTWDASRVASGVYYYALQSGASGNVKKMVLIK
jgi:hypothetical protein